MTIWLAAALALPLWLRAASVTAGISDRQVTMGEPVQFQVTVDADTPNPPDITPLQKDFAVAEQGAHQINNVTIINGRTTRESGTVYRYLLTPRKAGTLPIPSLTVKADGQEFKTPAGSLLVMAAAGGSLSFVEMPPPQHPVYVGEAVLLTVKWFVPTGSQIANVAFSLPVASDGSQVQPVPESGDGRNRVNVDGLRDPAGVSVVQEGRDGQLYDVIRLSAVWYPRISGTLSLGAPMVRFMVLDQSSRRTRNRADDFPMDIDSFFNRPSYRNSSAVGRESSVEVKPLPAAGRPAGFFGLVGKVAVTAAASPQAVRVGDPVTLSVLVGPAGFSAEMMKKFDLRRQAALARDFRLSNEADEGQAGKDGFLFSRTIRPLNAGVKEVPIIEIPYFDMETGKYEVARSQPIPLSVEGTKQVAQAEIGAVAEAPPAAVAAGLAANAEGPAVLDDQRVGLAVWRDHADWLALFFGAPAAWLLIAWLAWQRRQAGAAERALERRTLAALRNELKKDNPVPEKIQAAFQAWLGARLRMPPGTLTFADLEARGLGTPEAQAVFASFDLMRYGGAAAVAAAGIRDQVEQALAGLENHNGDKEERS
jgi:hypothetical protein